MIHRTVGVKEAVIPSIVAQTRAEWAAPSVYDKDMLHRVNTLLVILIIAINGFVVLSPLWPAVSYGLNKSSKQRQLSAKVEAVDSSGPNRLIAPAMQLEASILEGSKARAYSTLNEGIWRLPSGSTPDKGGNTVLIGHRFTYTNPRGVFYHLDKLNIGDSVAVIWNQEKYLYKVRETATVPASATSVEAPTDNDQLTLYTCTPLWLPKDRLVVIADLESS